jgi:hypothetical protein
VDVRIKISEPWVGKTRKRRWIHSGYLEAEHAPKVEGIFKIIATASATFDSLLYA